MSRPKVLFVDDEERIVRLLRMTFRDLYDVFTASGGAEALAILREHSIDVLVSDQRMPEMTGIQLLSETRQISPDTIRILLTGYSDLIAIIGAVNEGEVFRFLNKPWNQDEIKAVLAEAVQVAMASRVASGSRAAADAGREDAPPLATAVMLLSLDGVARDRHEVMEMFMGDYSVIPASSIHEAKEILAAMRDIGVIIADCQDTEEETVDKLADLARTQPSLTIIMLASVVDSEMVVKLINRANIYRFAMKPIRPNVFRLAVAAAIKEHNRRLAVVPYRPAMETEAKSGMVSSIVSSLSRFTKVW